MSKHLKRQHWLTQEQLALHGGRYEGVIADVVEQEVNNRREGRREVQPVIVFDDGIRYIPNFGIRRRLVDAFGSESTAWRGQRIAIVAQEQKPDRTTGEVRYFKTVEVLATCRQPGEDDAPLTAGDIRF